MRVSSLSFNAALVVFLLRSVSTFSIPKPHSLFSREDFGLEVPETEGGGFIPEGKNAVDGSYDDWVKDHPEEVESEGGGKNQGQDGSGKIDTQASGGKQPLNVNGADAEYDPASDTTEMGLKCTVKRRRGLLQYRNDGPCPTYLFSPKLKKVNNGWKDVEAQGRNYQDAQVKYCHAEIIRKLDALDVSNPLGTKVDFKDLGTDPTSPDLGSGTKLDPNKVALDATDLEIESPNSGKLDSPFTAQEPNTAAFYYIKGRDLLATYRKQMQKISDPKSESKLSDQLALQAKWMDKLKIDPVKAAEQMSGVKPEPKLLQPSRYIKKIGDDELNNIMYDLNNHQYSALLKNEDWDAWYPSRDDPNMDVKSEEALKMREEWTKLNKALEQQAKDIDAAEKQLEDYAGLKRGTLAGVLKKIYEIRQSLGGERLTIGSYEVAGYVFKMEGNKLIVKSTPWRKTNTVFLVTLGLGVGGGAVAQAESN